MGLPWEPPIKQCHVCAQPVFWIPDKVECLGVVESWQVLHSSPYLPVQQVLLPTPTPPITHVFTKYLFQALCSVNTSASPSPRYSLHPTFRVHSLISSRLVFKCHLCRGPPRPPFLTTWPHNIPSPHRDLFFFIALNIWYHLYVSFFSGSLHKNMRSRKDFIWLTAISLPCKPVSGTELPFSIELPNDWVTFSEDLLCIMHGAGSSRRHIQEEVTSHSRGADPKQGQGLHEAQCPSSLQPQRPCCASFGHSWLGSRGWSQDQGQTWIPRLDYWSDFRSFSGEFSSISLSVFWLKDGDNNFRGGFLSSFLSHYPWIYASATLKRRNYITHLLEKQRGVERRIYWTML